MKTAHYGLFMATILFFFGSCEKDELQSPLSGKKPAASEKNVPLITVAKGYECGRVICDVTTGPVERYNALRITNNNKELPSVTYTLCERISENLATGTEVYQPFAQFTCSQKTSTYATEEIDNGAHLLVYASDPAYAAPSATANVTLVFGIMSGQLPHTAYRTVTAGSYAGVPCTP